MLKGEVYQEEEVYDMSSFRDLDDDEDEALSFCDLPIYNGRDDDFSICNNQSSSYNEDDDDCFDFSFSSSSSSTQSLQEKNIIIFCGKIIRPHRKEEALPNINSAYYCKELLKGNNKSTCRSSKPRTTEKKTCHARKNNKTSKWYLLMMGLVKIHQGGKMELKDIKKRQTKRNHHRRCSSSTTSGNRELLGDFKIVKNNNKSHSGGSISGDINEMKVGGNSNKVGLLSLLRSFSCARTPTEDVDVGYCVRSKHRFGGFNNYGQLIRLHVFL